MFESMIVILWQSALQSMRAQHTDTTLPQERKERWEHQQRGGWSDVTLDQLMITLF